MSTVALDVQINSSPTLVVIGVGIHAGAGACVLSTAAPLELQALVVFGLLVSLVHIFGNHALRRYGRAIVRIRLDPKGAWSLAQRDGAMVPVRLRPGGYVHPNLVLLTFDTGRWWQRRSVVVLSDAADSARLRELRVHLLAARASPPRQP